ncbi:MAG: YkgJ family cysteine cluster protein [Myxococcota bacterium]
MNHLPECLRCGACCFSDLPTAVRVTGDDYSRLGDLADELTHFVGNRCYLRFDDGHCAALEINPATKTYTCRAYERRPSICRDLARGGPACLAERELKGERAHASLTQLRRSE